jgi:outer membrane protein OmpA-like peptidoglycan-associated protein
MRHLTIFALLFSLCTTAQDINQISVFFDFNSDYLKASEQQKIDSLLATPNIDIDKLVAHCDPIGTYASNIELAKLRNHSISDYMSSKGFIPKQEINLGEKESNESLKDKYVYYRRVDIHFSIPVNMPQENVNIFPDQFKDLSLDSEGSSTKPVVLKIQFEPGLDKLLGNSDLEIQNLYDFLRENENVSAFIRGHVCCTHDPVLSTARAYVVYKKLVDYGISPLRLKYEGFSNTIPAVSPEVIEEHRQSNRRVDVIFSKIK